MAKTTRGANRHFWSSAFWLFSAGCPRAAEWLFVSILNWEFTGMNSVYLSDTTFYIQADVTVTARGQNQLKQIATELAERI